MSNRSDASDNEWMQLIQKGLKMSHLWKKLKETLFPLDNKDCVLVHYWGPQILLKCTK